MHEYKRRIHFYETDAMGVIHHANYVLYFEEARVDFLHSSKALADMPLEEVNYPVIDLSITYKKSLLYSDGDFLVTVKPSLDRVRLIFDYELRIKRFSDPIAFGKTVHVAMDMKDQQVIRVPKQIVNLI